MIVHPFRSKMLTFIATTMATSAAWSAPTCPLSYGTTDSAKSHKLYLYFPTVNDPTFPAYTPGASPAHLFDVAELNPAIGTTAALRNRIYDVVADDYCEFNVEVIQTTTNPATLPMPPARRVTVAVGTDNPTGAWGQAQEVDIGDTINIDFARVWAGTYTTCEGGAPGGGGGCSASGELTGANATVERWAQAIGGTAAHEAGHTYGLSHTDDNPPGDLGGQPGPAPLPGEDSFHRHLMPAGYNLTGEDRATYRRHISDRTYGLLATNVGLSVQTMHNWDLVNPNAQEARRLTVDFLSTLPAVNLTWSWTGASNPWINPVVTGPMGTTTFKGTMYNRYRITWSTPNPAWMVAAPGVLPGGGHFHIGATFTGVDFNQPDPIIVNQITLYNASNNPLVLHPRIPMYDAGTVDSADGSFDLNFFAPAGGANMFMESAVIYQLPRVASMESLTGEGRPFGFDQMPIRPLATVKCAKTHLREKAHCGIANIKDKPHFQATYRLGEEGVYDCSKGVPQVQPPSIRKTQDSPFMPDYEGPICAGSTRDPFPSTTIYAVATFVDPKAKHYDPRSKKYIVGPVKSRVYYQFAGVRDLQKWRKPEYQRPIKKQPTSASNS